MKFHTILIASLIALTISAAAPAQNYTGSAACGFCHSDEYNVWIDTGHHYSLTQNSGSVPYYPFSYHSGRHNVPDPPVVSGSLLNWNDIGYIIGGYFYKANFCDAEGYLLTGAGSDSTLWNVRAEEWIPYHPGQSIPFDCAECHATGYDPAGHQGGLPGVVGQWAENGVGCEACHGPGS